MSTVIQVLMILVFVALVGLIWYWLETKQKTKRLEEAFAGRTPLDEQGFYEEYFKETGIPADIVVRIRRIFEKCLEVDLSRLSAEDEFMGNLEFFWHYESLAGVMIVMDIEEEFHIHFSDDETANIKTVREAIEKVWEKVCEQTVKASADT